MACPSYCLQSAWKCQLRTISLPDFAKTHTSIELDVDDCNDTWNWVWGQQSNSTEVAIPKWAQLLILEEYHSQKFTGQLFHCSTGWLRSCHQKDEGRCPWKKFLVFDSQAFLKRTPPPQDVICTVYQRYDGEENLSSKPADHALWNPGEHKKPQAVLAMRKDWVEHLEKSQSITPSETILSFQEKLVESDLSPSTKANFIQQSSKMGNTLKYWKQKVFFSFFLFFFFSFFFFLFFFFFFFFCESIYIDWLNVLPAIVSRITNFWCWENGSMPLYRGGLIQIWVWRLSLCLHWTWFEDPNCQLCKTKYERIFHWWCF